MNFKAILFDLDGTLLDTLGDLHSAVNRALEKGKPEDAAARVKATATFRLLGCLLLCVILIAVFKTNVFATLIPLLFPRIGIAFRPMIDRKRGVNPPETEGSDLID